MKHTNCAAWDLTKAAQPRTLADTFDGLDSPVNSFLARAIAKNALPRLLLLTGPPGSGKGTRTRIIGRRHLCENKAAHPYEPCAVCRYCRSIDDASGSIRWSHYGYTEFDATTMEGQKIIDILDQESKWSPIECVAEQLFVLDELSRARKGLQERLLRFSENTSARIILTTIDPKSLLPPLLSRYTHLALVPPTEQQTVRGLCRIADQHGYKLAEAAAQQIARAKVNCPRECVKLLGVAMTIADEGRHVSCIDVTTALGMEGRQHASR